MSPTLLHTYLLYTSVIVCSASRVTIDTGQFLTHTFFRPPPPPMQVHHA
jgi:hypothetical protein